MKAVCVAVAKSVYVAGSIYTPEQTAELKSAGAAAFTKGTAALDAKYPADGKDLASQLSAIIQDVAALNQHLSPFHKQSLGKSFSRFSDTWSPKITGQINNMQMKLAKFHGAFVWHFHEHEDELFFVHRGRLLMKFRDREEVIEEGEFIVVPHGVEHCPVALTDTCEIVLLEPETTLNTGTATDARTVSGLNHI